MKRQILSRRTFLKAIGITAALPTSLLTAKTIIPPENKFKSPMSQVYKGFEGPLTEEMLIEAIGNSNAKNTRMYANEDFLQAVGEISGDKFWYKNNPRIGLIERI